MIILSTAYWGTIEYFAALLSGDAAIDCAEHYVKQSYRNRCRIMSSSGALALTIPVEKISGGRTPVKDIRIDYAMAWQKNHWRAIVSAYRNSPYFDHYEDMIAPLYHQRYQFLAEYNTLITECVYNMMALNPNYRLSDIYVEKDEGVDMRDLISPKRESSFVYQPYYQVFSEELPFAANLSVFDLLMCQGGRDAKEIIKNGVWENYQK